MDIHAPLHQQSIVVSGTAHYIVHITYLVPTDVTSTSVKAKDSTNGRATPIVVVRCCSLHRDRLGTDVGCGQQSASSRTLTSCGELGLQRSLRLCMKPSFPALLEVSRCVFRVLSAGIIAGVIKDFRPSPRLLTPNELQYKNHSTAVLSSSCSSACSVSCSPFEGTSTTTSIETSLREVP